MGGPVRESVNAGEHGYSPQKDNYAKRLRRIEGQVRGIAKMIDDDKYCIDILTQISAVNSALQSVALGLLDEHLGHCVTQARRRGRAVRPTPSSARGVGGHRPAGPILEPGAAQKSQSRNAVRPAGDQTPGQWCGPGGEEGSARPRQG